MDLSLNKRWLPVLLALGTLLIFAAVACGGDDDEDDAAPAATTAPAAATSTPVPEATKAQAAATATTAPVAMEDGPSGDLVRAFRTLESIYGLPYVGPYRGSAHTQLGGVEEHLFIFENGNPMTPELVESWDIANCLVFGSSIINESTTLTSPSLVRSDNSSR